MSSPSTIRFDPSPSTSSRSIMGPSERRLGLTFFPPSTGNVTLNTNPIAAFGDGIVIEAGQAPYHFDRATEGDIVSQGWYALYSNGATGVSWVEQMLCNVYDTFYG